MRAKFVKFGGIRSNCNSSEFSKLGIADVYQSRSWMYNYLFHWPNETVLQVDTDDDKIEIVEGTPASIDYPFEVAVVVWNCNLNKRLAKKELKCKRCGNITNASVSKYSLLGFLKGEAKRCYISKEKGTDYWFQGCAHDESYDKKPQKDSLEVLATK